LKSFAVVFNSDRSHDSVLFVAGSMKLCINQASLANINRSDRLNDHLVCRVHRESFAIFLLTSRLLDNLIIVELLVALLGGEDIEVHVVIQIVLSVNLNLGL